MTSLHDRSASYGTEGLLVRCISNRYGNTHGSHLTLHSVTAGIRRNPCRSSSHTTLRLPCAPGEYWGGIWSPQCLRRAFAGWLGTCPGRCWFSGGIRIEGAAFHQDGRDKVQGTDQYSSTSDSIETHKSASQSRSKWSRIVCERNCRGRNQLVKGHKPNCRGPIG